VTERSELDVAREYLAQAQKLNDIGMHGQAFFVMGCAVNNLIEHLNSDKK
jgi:hypothetical protein